MNEKFLSCYKCKSFKPIEAFYIRDDGSKLSACKKCQKYLKIDRELKNNNSINEDKIIEDFFSHDFSWTVPKISSSNLYFTWQRFNIFSKFNLQDWNKNQIEYLKQLSHNDLYNPSSKEGKNFESGALARLHKRLFELLGLIYEDEYGFINITYAGYQFLTTKNLLEIKINQIQKFIYPNPVFGQFTKDCNINPHQFLLKILIEIEDNYITKEEYVIFVCRSRNFAEINSVIAKIKFWRGQANQKHILNQLKGEISTKRNNSFYKKFENDANYSTQFFGHCDYISLDDIEETPEIEYVSIPKEKLNYAKEIYSSLKDFYHVNIDNISDWVDYYSFDIKKYQIKKIPENKPIKKINIMNEFKRFTKNYINSNGIISVNICLDKFKISEEEFFDYYNKLNKFEFTDNAQDWFFDKNNISNNKLYKLGLKLFSNSKKYLIDDFINAINRTNQLEIMSTRDKILSYFNKCFNAESDGENIFIENILENELPEFEEKIISCFDNNKILHRDEFLVIAENKQINLRKAGFYLSLGPLVKRVQKAIYAKVNSNITHDEILEYVEKINKNKKNIKDWGYKEDGSVWFGTSLNKLNLIGENIVVPLHLAHLIKNKDFKIMEDRGVNMTRKINLNSNNSLSGIEKEDLINAKNLDQLIIEFNLINLFAKMNIYSHNKIKELQQ